MYKTTNVSWLYQCLGNFKLKPFFKIHTKVARQQTNIAIHYCKNVLIKDNDVNFKYERIKEKNIFKIPMNSGRSWRKSYTTSTCTTIEKKYIKYNCILLNVLYLNMHLNVTTVKCSINKYEYIYVKQNRQQNNKLINYTLVETNSYNIHIYIIMFLFISQRNIRRTYGLSYTFISVVTLLSTISHQSNQIET